MGGSAESDWGSLVAGNNQDITRLLKDVHEGRGGALDDLMKAVYDDLQHVAERHMTQRFGHDLPGVTMEPAALVNESFLKIIKQRNTYDNRGQFFAIATFGGCAHRFGGDSQKAFHGLSRFGPPRGSGRRQ